MAVWTIEAYIALGLGLLFLVVLAVFIYLWLFPRVNGFDRLGSRKQSEKLVGNKASSTGSSKVSIGKRMPPSIGRKR